MKKKKNKLFWIIGAVILISIIYFNLNFTINSNGNLITLKDYNNTLKISNCVITDTMLDCYSNGQITITHKTYSNSSEVSCLHILNEQIIEEQKVKEPIEILDYKGVKIKHLIDFDTYNYCSQDDNFMIMNYNTDTFNKYLQVLIK